MMKILFLLLFINSTFVAQWEWINPTPTNNAFDGIYLFSDDSMFICGERGTVISYVDNDFTRLNTNTSQRLFDIYFLNQNIGWAAGIGQGLEGTILKTTDRGRSWEKQTLRLDSTPEIRKIQFINENKGWAIAGSGTILGSLDGGNSWSIMYDNYLTGLRDLTFINDSMGIVAGSTSEHQYYGANNYCTILLTQDGGQSWRENYLPYEGWISSISVVNNDIIYGSGIKGLIIKSDDGGETWKKLKFPSQSYPIDIHFINEDKGFVSVYNYVNSRYNIVIYKTEDGGSSWTKVDPHILGYIEEIKFIDEYTGYGIGRYGSIIKTIDGGNTWRSLRRGFLDDINSIFIKEDNVWVGTSSSEIKTTSTYGSNWETIKIPNISGINDLLFFDSHVGLAATNRNGVWKTTDGGKNWNGTSLDSVSIKTIELNYNNKIWVVGGNVRGEVHSTDDQGETWQEVTIDTTQSWLYEFYDLDFINNRIGWLVGRDGQIYHTTDGGNTWERQFVGFSHTFFSVKPLTKDKVFIVGSGGLLLSTGDGGENWNKYSFNERHFREDLNSIEFTNQGEGLIVGNNGAIISSKDGGNIWEIEESPTEHNLNDVFISDSTFFISGELGTLIKRDLDFTVGFNDNDKSSISINFTLSQNYPNPFNPTTRIKYQVASIEIVSLKVYDVLGREIVTLIDNKPMQPGEYEVTFEGSGLPSGVYFYRITSGDFVQSRKMVLIK